MSRLLRIAEALDDHQRRADWQKAEREANPNTMWKSSIMDVPFSLQVEDKTWVHIEWRDLAALFRAAANSETKAQQESSSSNSTHTAPKAGNDV